MPQISSGAALDGWWTSWPKSRSRSAQLLHPARTPGRLWRPRRSTTTCEWTASRRRLRRLGLVGRRGQQSSRLAALSPKLQLHSSSSRSGNASNRRLLLRRRVPPGTSHLGRRASGASPPAGLVAAGRSSIPAAARWGAPGRCSTQAGGAGAARHATTSARCTARPGTAPNSARKERGALSGTIRTHPRPGTETGSRV